MNYKLKKIIEKFKDKNIIIIGDVMLDKYIFGNVDRISPEAPVQVVEVKKESYIPGGAANVANNIASLKGNAYMVGIVGKDNPAKILIDELKRRNINTEGIFIDERRPTIQKVRILGHQQQLLRIDYEKKEYVKKDIEKRILDFLKEKINETDAIIISDYAKGLINQNLMDEIKVIANNKIIIVDPKPKHINFYKNVSLVTPNEKEAKEMIDKENVEEIGKRLLQKVQSPVLITRGEKGMSLFEKDGTITNIPTKAKEVYDVSGAGDTTVATLTLSLASGSTIKEAAILANHAAGIVVGKVGTATITDDELKNSIQNE